MILKDISDILFKICLLFLLIELHCDAKERRHIITPQRINRMDVHMQRRSHVFARPTRKHANNDFIYYKIDLDGKEYYLELQLNEKGKHNSSVPGKCMENKTIANVIVRKYPQSLCQFIGSVKGFPSSKAALSNCDGLLGYILLNDVLYLIEPLRLNATKVSDSGHPHALYIHEQIKHVKNGGCGVESGKYQRKEYVERPVKSRSPESLRHKVGHVAPMYIEVLLVLDKTLLDFHTSIDVQNYVLTCMNIARTAISDRTFGVPMELVVVRMISLEQEDDEMNLAISADSQKVLEVFEAWSNRINPPYDTNPDHHDIAILLTRVDLCSNEAIGCGLLGLTTLGTLCDPDHSAIIIEDNGLSLGFTIAHEIGHAMSMLHDTETESACNPRPHGSNYSVVMALEVAMWMRGWSNCSREYLYSWIDSGRGHCLYDEPQKNKFLLPIVEAGAAFGIHHQCHFFFGKDSTGCADVGVECHNLKCYLPLYGCVETGAPMADGSACAADRWCQRGRCVQRGLRVDAGDAVDGGWSEWSPWSQCSRSCGRGVATARRRCERPQPSAGGRYCLGRRVRHRVCNPQPCPASMPNFIDLQCEDFNQWVFPQTNQTHTWIGALIPTANPCELICENEIKQRVVLKAEVADGTPCYRGENHICISGYCTYVPCDLRIGSRAAEDACGVCDGDGTTCVVHTDYMRFKPKCNLQLALKVRKHSSFVVMEELAPTSSYFVVYAGSAQILSGKKMGITRFDSMSLWLGQVRHQQEILKIRGPVTKDLKILMAAKDEVTIKYTVTTPADGRERNHFYSWHYVGWTDCSEPCGPGTQISEPKCVDKGAGVVHNKHCTNKEKLPTMHRICELQKCHPRWQVGEWSGCECECDDDEEEERAVDCVRKAGGRGEVVVAEDECPPPKPQDVRSCVCLKRHPCPLHRYKNNSRTLRYSWKDFKMDFMAKEQSNQINTPLLLSRPHEQNVYAAKQMSGTLIMDYQDMSKINLALEIDEENRQRKDLIKDFPQPKGNENLVHLRGKAALKFISRIQSQSHKKNKD